MARYALEAVWIRTRGWAWTALEAIAIFAVLVGGIRLFAPLVPGSSALEQALLAGYNFLAPLPQLGSVTYIFGGLIATLVINWLR